MSHCRQHDGQGPLKTAQGYHQRACACAADKTRLSEAVHYSRLALQAAPDNPVYHAFLARDLAQVGRIQEAVALLAQAARMAPDRADIRASYLWYLSYLPEQTPEQTFSGYRQWAADFTPVSRARTRHTRVLDPGRRLRIGYISPDLRRHSVAYYLEPILDGHDRQRVQVFGYGNVAQPDEVTRRLQAKFDGYRSIWGQAPDAVADLIEQDQIDILVALAGHCSNNSLQALAYKPAPVQVDLGGVTTTGMLQVDYRVSDRVVDPPAYRHCFSERLVYLPGGWSVFRPPQHSPPVGPLPARGNGHFTFGTFNNNIKIGEPVVALWSRILRACPDAVLLFKCFAADDAGIRRTYLDLFAHHGVAQERLHFCGERPYDQHLALLGSVDLALDTFPFSGAMTTLEGLWMGVPIVTLVGQTCVSRQGYDLLLRLGLDVFAAQDPDEYVAKAVSFTRQWDELERIRSALRHLMLDSPLCRPGRMAWELEAAYRTMWVNWVAGQRSRPIPVGSGHAVSAARGSG